jgi:hypothetical protein
MIKGTPYCKYVDSFARRSRIDFQMFGSNNRGQVERAEQASIE